MPTTKKPAAKKKKAANGGSSKAAAGKPKVKTLAAPKAKEAKTEVYMVELVEGSSYTVVGQAFLINRPVAVSNPAILARVLKSSRFKCKVHKKPPPPKKEKKTKKGEE